MKINTNNNTYKAIKEQFVQKKSKLKQEAQERIREAKEYIEPKIKEAASKAADWSDERISDAKEIYSITKQKIQPKVDEFTAYAQFALNPPKSQVLREKMTTAQMKYLQKGAFLSILKTKYPENPTMILQKEKEFKQLKQQALIAAEKYNKFIEQEVAAQKAFEHLNK